jgi:hypothetical protein
MLAAVIGDSRYAIAFAVTALFPLIAIPLVPVQRVTKENPVAVRP